MPKFRLASLSFLLTVLAVIALFQPVPYILEKPGPLFNALGEIDGQKLVAISGTKTYPTSGELNMTTVSVYGGPQEGVDLLQAIQGWLDPRINVQPRELIYPENLTEEEEQQMNVADFSESQSNATAAALNYLGLPIKSQIFVDSVATDYPADGKLEPNDVLLKINGLEVLSAGQAVRLIRRNPVGSVVKITVIRDGKVKAINIRTVSHPHNKKLAYVGIGVQTKFSADFNIDFEVNDVGGPSGGTMFALSIIDKLTPGKLNDGKKIAGTGTITPEGEVGAIGGIEQKMYASAEHGVALFLAPAENCGDLLGGVPQGLKVVPVATLDQAVQALNDFKLGKKLPTVQSVCANKE